MRLWNWLRSWLRAVARRPRMEREMDAELRFHIEAVAEDLVRSGVPRDEASRRARIEFGGVERAKEECREARGTSFAESLLQDLHFGLRMLRKSPGFTAIALLTLAFGIGANTAIFSVVYTVLLKALPYPQAERLVMVYEDVKLPNYQNKRNTPSPGNFSDWSVQNTVFENMAAYSSRSFNVTGTGEPLRLEGELVSAGFFSTLRMTAALG